MTGGDETERFLSALRHPLRRRILRLAVQWAEEGLSPKKATPILGVHLSTASYHFRQLAKADVIALAFTRPGRGAIEHFYRPIPSALDNPMVQIALSETEATDS